MKPLVNRRTSLRRRQKRHGPKRKTIVTRLRTRSDKTMVLDLASAAMQSMGKKVGGRVWFFVKEHGLHITGYPWGPHAGRRESSRIRTAHISMRRGNTRGVNPPRGSQLVTT